MITPPSTARRRAAGPARSFVAGVGALAIAVGAVSCSADPARPAASGNEATMTATSEPSGVEASTPATPEALGAESMPGSSTSPASTPTAPTITTPATAAPTSTTPATAPPTSTTVADLLTEAEVAEVERALDELDVLLGEIDADLADLPDP